MKYRVSSMSSKLKYRVSCGLLKSDHCTAFVIALLCTIYHRTMLTHCGLVTPNGDIDSEINIGLCNGLVPDGTKPLHEPMLTYHWRCCVAFTCEWFHKKRNPWNGFGDYTLKSLRNLQRDNELKWDQTVSGIILGDLPMKTNQPRTEISGYWLPNLFQK